MKLKSDELASRLENFIPQEWSKDREFLIKIVEIEKERIKRLTDFSRLVGFFLNYQITQPSF